MTSYLVLYRADTTAAERLQAMSPDEGAASMQKWMDWQSKAGDTVVDYGSPTQPVAGADEGSTTSIGGYSIMQADSLDELLEKLEYHPHKEMGGRIEVLELLSVPGT